MAVNGIHAFEKDALTCAICTDTYIDPCTLSCGHSFCRKCVTKYTKKCLETEKSNTIPCRFCDQVTVVPNPKKPVGEWAWQIEPSPVVQQLMEKQRCGTTHDKGLDVCHLCKENGEKTSASSWCSNCDVTLCRRCTLKHVEVSSDKKHDILEMVHEEKEKEERNIKCNDHESEAIKFICKDCNKTACQTCCISQHGACKGFEGKMTGKLDTEELQMSNIGELQNTKTRTRAEVKSAIANAITLLRKKERELSKQIDDASEKQIAQHKANLKLAQISTQTYHQHCEFIDQALQSDSEMDIYEMYQVYQSGVMESVGGTGLDTRNTPVVGKVNFTLNIRPLTNAIMEMGKIDVIFITEETPLLQSGNKDETKTLPTPVFLGDIDIRHDEDPDFPTPIGVTVLNVDGIHTVVVSDFLNSSLKSIYVKNGRKEMSLLSLSGKPESITKMTDSHVAVSTEDCHIVIAEVQPELVLLTTLQTNKSYINITALPDSKFAAVAFRFPAIDIIDMKGRITRHLSRVTTEKNLIQEPYVLCTTHEGNILIADLGSKSVYSLTSDGDIVFSSKLSGDQEFRQPSGVTVTSKGDILLTDKGKVIQMTSEGKFIRDLLTRSDDIFKPVGLCLDEFNKLYVCQGYNGFKVYSFT